ncbi:MAG: MFS transporter [Solirubrobacteraceae bacterium]|nr:MFS transporter [Patulibacter sp.]
MPKPIPSLRTIVSRIAIDTTPLRESRDLRRLITGGFISNIGTQAALVALPFQLYDESHSALAVGMLGAAELVPLITMALLGGALADRVDRRKLLLFDQIGLVACSATLAALAFSGWSPIAMLYLIGALLAGFGSVQNVARGAIVPNLIAPERLRSALALNYGLQSLSLVIGPGLGGLVIAAGGVGTAYAIDAISCFALVFAVIEMAPQPPGHTTFKADGATADVEVVDVGADTGTVAADARPAAEAPNPTTTSAPEPQESIGRSIADGLRFVRSKPALLGSFAIDLSAMTFGMPRTLFPVMAVSIYHAGASGTGLLYAAVSAGSTVAALTTGWLARTRKLGIVVIWAVVAWGGAIAIAGLAGSIWIAAFMLAVAGAADSVSAVCRSTINQTVTPDIMRGRMSAVFSLVVTSGPRLGDIESGTVASLTTTRFSVVSGGVATIVAAGLLAVSVPALARYDAEVAIAEAEALERDLAGGTPRTV